VSAAEVLQALVAHFDAGGKLITGDCPWVHEARRILATGGDRYPTAEGESAPVEPDHARAAACEKTAAPTGELGSGLSAEDLARRRNTLGSSEIGTVCGVNPYASMHDVWMSKCLGVETEPNEAMTLGNLIEPTIVAIWCNRYGKSTSKGRYAIGPEPWISATPDAYIDGEDGLVEAKLVGLRQLWMWGQGDTDATESDAIPMYYLTQCHWQMLVTGRSFVKLAALMGTEFRTYTIRANPDVQAKLVARGRDFWHRYVVTKTPPPVDASDGAREMLKRLYPKSGADAIPADAKLQELAECLLQAREDLARATAAKQLWENQIKSLLGEARGAFAEDWRIRYATTKAGQRPFVFDHMREKEGKAA
jgi:putative phage-type endonuclease